MTSATTVDAIFAADARVDKMSAAARVLALNRTSWAAASLLGGNGTAGAVADAGAGG